MPAMNGAQALISTLTANGVDTCFMNPGTSEMHFVAALDRVPQMRSVLALFEGVATGAADGYARTAGRPAATLLHLGPGLANGLANLHNARRARTPIVNIVGDHATHHKRYDAPLESDIESLAQPMSGWFRASRTIADLPGDVVAAIDAAIGPPFTVATLVVPADLCWGAMPEEAPFEASSPPLSMAASGALRATPVDGEAIEAAAKALVSGEKAAILLGGTATRKRSLVAASRVAATTGAKLLAENFPPILDRGAGIPPVERLGYLAEFIQAQLEGVRHLILVDAASPVSFFAYPGRPSNLVPDGCEVIALAGPSHDCPAALEALADAVGAEPGSATLQPASRPDRPTGTLDLPAAAAAIGALLPEDAIVVDEAATSGVFIPGATAGCPPHLWLCALQGGSIGHGLPLATGAAMGAADRKVLCLQADGSAMYTIQALWTQARMGTDVTTVVFANHAYGILELELSRVGAEPPGPKAREMLDLSGPTLDFVHLAQAMGVPAARATTADELVEQLERALAEPGPALVEAVVPRL